MRYLYLVLAVLAFYDVYLVVATSQRVSALQEQVDGLKQDLVARDQKFKELQDRQKANFETTLELLRKDVIEPPLPSGKP